jgi:CRISPR/Cas system-associated exonuclease Cas4 (RecB family)
MAIKTHTDLSPSNSSRWLNCPGSVALCKTVPKPPQSPYAAEGEVAHKVLEDYLRDPNRLPFDRVGEVISGIEVTEEMAEAVSFARDTIMAELQKNNGELIVEKKISILPGIDGTLDVGIILPYKSITVFDFKYGKGVIVSAVDNTQLLLYALPLSKEYEVESIKLVILQPRTEGQISIWEANCDYLETFAKEVERKIALAQEKDALVCPGTWCKFCQAKIVCPAFRQDISSNLPAIPGKELVFPDVKGLSVTTIKNVLDFQDRIEDWMNAVAAYAKEYVEVGGEIPGYELAKKRSNRKWISEELVLKEFADLGEKAFSVKPLSPAQMEKVAGKERVAKLTEIPDNGMTLKKIGEKK